MSTSLEVDLESLYLNNYVSLVMVTAVVYDYALTFTTEIEHIWKRPWTWVSTMFLLVRYGGLISLIMTALAGTTFVPGPLWMQVFRKLLPITMLKSIFYLKGKMLLYVASWTNIIFTNSADLVMIFRVYALFGRSRIILDLLLFIFSGEVVASFGAGIVYSKPGAVLVMIPPEPDPPVCIVQYYSWNWGRYSVIPLVVLQGTMCLLAIYQSFRQSYQLYKATKRWQFNQYFKLFVNQGIMYFFMNFLHTIITQGLFSIAISQTVGLILTPTTEILIFALNPRFILSIRELYAHTVYSQSIDTGFGMVGHGAGTMTNIGTRLHFADAGAGLGEDTVEIEDVPMEELRAKRFIDRV